MLMFLFRRICPSWHMSQAWIITIFSNVPIIWENQKNLSQKEPPEVSCKRRCSQKFRTFLGKTAVLDSHLQAQANTYFEEHLRTTASGKLPFYLDPRVIFCLLRCGVIVKLTNNIQLIFSFYNVNLCYSNQKVTNVCHKYNYNNYRRMKKMQCLSFQNNLYNIKRKNCVTIRNEQRKQV